MYDCLLRSKKKQKAEGSKQYAKEDIYRTAYCLLPTAYCLFFLLLAPFVQAQTPTVTIDMKQVPIEDILPELEKQTGVFFSYESSLLKGLPKVSLQAEDELLSYCLKKLFDGLPIIYRVTNGHIILKKKPRRYTISGFVRDSVSYESLINATVLEGVTGKSTVSNNYGFYSITLPAGKVVLRSSYVGYQPREITLELERDTLIDFPLLY